MKKCILLISVLFIFIFMLLSCQKEKSVDEVSIFYSFKDMVEFSENVYTAELLKYEETGVYDEHGGDQIKVWLRIGTVFKGTYLPGERIEYILPSAHYLLNEYVGAEENGNYLFMTGVDFDYSGELEDYPVEHILNQNMYNIIRIEDDGTLKQRADHYKEATKVFKGGMPPKDYEEILSRIFELDSYKNLLEFYYGVDNLVTACDKAENVYIGEIVEKGAYLMIEGPQKRNIGFRRVKVKIKTVYKGEYMPGDTVEDIIIEQNRTNENNVEIVEQFIISGGMFDCGYSLDDEIWDTL